jgi:hypothetical protein
LQRTPFSVSTKVTTQHHFFPHGFASPPSGDKCFLASLLRVLGPLSDLPSRRNICVISSRRSFSVRWG